MVEKNIEISILSQIYKDILTEKQFEILDQYYNNDYSLSEIAENYNITRQAVRDNIKNGESKLYDLENKLGIMKKNEKQQKIIEDIITKLDNLEIKDKVSSYYGTFFLFNLYVSLIPKINIKIPAKNAVITRTLLTIILKLNFDFVLEVTGIFFVLRKLFFIITIPPIQNGIENNRSI